MGIALRQSDPAFGVVQQFYNAAKREPTTKGSVSVMSTDTFTPNFLDLLRMLDAKQQTEVVVVCHGGADGLIMSMSPNSNVSAKDLILVDLLDIVDNGDATKRAAFINNASVTEDELAELERLAKKIRAHLASSVDVHIRGCKIGKTVGNLATIRKLLAARLVSAPSCPMLYAPYSPNWHRPTFDYEGWKTKNPPVTRRREFALGSAKMVLDVNYTGGSSAADGAITDINQFTPWLTQLYGNSSHGLTRNGPIAAMWPDSDYFLPHESGYVSQLVTSP
jgi:hypothetical protein